MDMNLKEKKIIIATHFHHHGAAQDMQEYLLANNIGRLIFIGHPIFQDKKLDGSFYRIYKKQKITREKILRNFKIPSLLNYIKDFFLNIYWVIKTKTKWDLYVGCDPLNASCGVLLKKLGFAKKTVFYCIDYSPVRFNNSVLNNIYHSFDKFCVRNCDETWNVSSNIMLAREKYRNLKPSIYNRQITVPIGVWIGRIKQKEIFEIKKHTLVFVGHILEKQGVQHVLGSVPKIIKEIPDFKFMIIGGGEYLESLKKIAKDLGIEKQIYFHGYEDDQKKIGEILSECTLAIAPYKRYTNGVLNYTYFADPTKIKTYLSCGLPVLLTDVPYNARDIENNAAGKIIRENEDDMAEKIITMMKDERTLLEYRKNAILYIKQFNWNVIFKKNLERILFE